jgi:hypothetical protein
VLVAAEVYASKYASRSLKRTLQLHVPFLHHPSTQASYRNHGNRVARTRMPCKQDDVHHTFFCALCRSSSPLCFEAGYSLIEVAIRLAGSSITCQPGCKHDERGDLSSKVIHQIDLTRKSIETSRSLVGSSYTLISVNSEPYSSLEHISIFSMERFAPCSIVQATSAMSPYNGVYSTPSHDTGG